MESQKCELDGLSIVPTQDLVWPSRGLLLRIYVMSQESWESQEIEFLFPRQFSLVLLRCSSVIPLITKYIEEIYLTAVIKAQE